MEDEGLFTTMQEKHVAQVTGTITLLQISNVNRQQFTNNGSNSTFNNAQFTGFRARTAEETPKSFLEGARTPFIYPCSTGCYTSRGNIWHILVSPLLMEISRKGSHIRESSNCSQDRQIRRQVA
ncbi:hypothetical protein AVEN_196358-1 [Araneus ventricosus]|uniref:Uncharacterized protein n=1 Tax=Araneus ventricosus TaxID=182803 RepID=A0A4Y2AU21_ARAVE|nr:hypothetical protein AVEN_196358-1 [Araneus ventricosus]